MHEPLPPDPSWPRYSTGAFPAYRYIPGRSPHPRRHARGHSFGSPEPESAPCVPARWRESERYRYGIDLHNFAYWWECHEALESIWRPAKRQSPERRFLKALIQLAAAHLKRFAGQGRAARHLAARAGAALAAFDVPFMGADVPVLREKLERNFHHGESVLIRLT